MKDRVLIAIFSVLVFTALIMGQYAHPGNGFEDMLWVIVPIVICGFSISFMVFALSEKHRKTAFFESLKYAFGISALILILGYFIFCLNPIIFNG